MEIKLNLPKAFTGKQTKLNKFIQDVTLYLAINQEVYNNDEKKIAFLLSYMTVIYHFHQVLFPCLYYFSVLTVMAADIRAIRVRSE